MTDGEGELFPYTWPKPTGEEFEIRLYRTPQGHAARLFKDGKELGSPYDGPYVLIDPRQRMEPWDEINRKHVLEFAMLAIREHWYTSSDNAGGQPFLIEIKFQYPAQ